MEIDWLSFFVGFILFTMLLEFRDWLRNKSEDKKHHLSMWMMDNKHRSEQLHRDWLESQNAISFHEWHAVEKHINNKENLKTALAWIEPRVERSLLEADKKRYEMLKWLSEQ